MLNSISKSADLFTLQKITELFRVKVPNLTFTTGSFCICSMGTSVYRLSLGPRDKDCLTLQAKYDSYRHLIL